MPNFVALHHLAPQGTVFTHIRTEAKLEELLTLAQPNDTLHKVSELAVTNFAVLDREMQTQLTNGQFVKLNPTELQHVSS